MRSSPVKAVILVLFIAGLFQTAEPFSPPPEVWAANPVILKTLRGGKHKDYFSIVFQFDNDFKVEKPVIRNKELIFNLENVVTTLKPFRQYSTFSSWVRLKPSGEKLNVRIGLPEDLSKLGYLYLTNPYRLAVNLYLKEKPGKAPEAPGRTVKTPPPPPDKTSPAVPAPQKPTPDTSTSAQRPPAKAHPQEPNSLITLNFRDVDIRELISALALKREINVVMSNEVSGKVSVHLYQMTLKEALDAITLAGGYAYYKHDDLYYIYKPKTPQDPNAKNLQIQLFKLKYASTEKLQEVIQSIGGIGMIKIHDASKTIIVEDTPENIAKIQKIIKFWDQVPRQVMIEVKILKVTLTDNMDLGVNWNQLLGDLTLATGGLSSAVLPTLANPGLSPLPSDGKGLFANIITGRGTNAQFAAALNWLQTITNVETLSTPKILAVHGKQARVQVGGQQGYQSQSLTAEGGARTAEVKFIDTGTILDITPFIDDSNNVLLQVKPSIRSADISASGIPVVTATDVSTELIAKDGETVFIGGLIEGTKTKTRTKIPCLGDIPLLGLLFGTSNRGIDKKELVILITPQISDIGRRTPDQEEPQEKVKQADKTFKEEPLPLLKKLIELSP
ncbi:MAG: secretin N-terminal domain-containing protein [Desulfobacterales bacterium]|nr:secretin N-terminal domain-containing protein [Desulfobacterales bacterium]